MIIVGCGLALSAVGPGGRVLGVGSGLVECSGQLLGWISGMRACGMAAAGAGWGFGAGVVVRSAETGSFGGVPGAEQSVEAGLVADEPYGDAAGVADDHGGDADDAGEEAAELHPDVDMPVGF